ncbi:hypothetical protein AD945_15700 [Gluconobacter albidus]|uniref:Uncharacterized protein n=1 Tax=Gluconobacter albidus TaxID=318683 RepID=A0A149TDT3_9PROT|nr:hypothetical protein AD945_15700 [Gluconobacter albidus]
MTGHKNFARHPEYSLLRSTDIFTVGGNIQMNARKILCSLALFATLISQAACSGNWVLEKRLTPADTLQATSKRTVVPGTFVMTVKSVNVFNKMVFLNSEDTYLDRANVAVQITSSVAYNADIRFGGDFRNMVLNRKILVIGSAMKVGADLEQGIIVNTKGDERTYIFVSRASNIFFE